jgi:bacterial/archaeal transporter family-2 protein
MIGWVCVGLAIAAGLASGVQGPANGALARQWDFWRAVTLNGLVVFLVTATFFAFTRKDAPQPQKAPLSHMIGGLCGALVISAAAFAAPRIGAAKFTVGLVLGMLLASVVVDHYGWYGQTIRPATPMKLLGVGLVLLGVFLVRLKDA